MQQATRTVDVGHLPHLVQRGNRAAGAGRGIAAGDDGKRLAEAVRRARAKEPAELAAMAACREAGLAGAEIVVRAIQVE